MGALVLLLEHDRRLAAALTAVLETGRFFKVLVSPNAQHGLRLLAKKLPAAVLVDRELPDMDAFDVCRMLRQRSRTAGVPIIVVGSRSSRHDRVRGLDLGVDDFLSGPYNAEDCAKLRAIIRRRPPTPSPPEAEVFHGAHITLDFGCPDVVVDQAVVRLTRLEFELLGFLVQHRNRVFTREELLQHVWGKHGANGTNVDRLIARLRGKLGSAGGQIRTSVRTGYWFDEGAGVR